ncbi:MAG: glycosyltransferase [Patescibacteria group bacterium]|nr:glycosyltransferase [Patescibacteria group bacterium]
MKPFFRKLHKFCFKIFLWPPVNTKFIRTPALFESITSADPRKLFVFVTAFNEPKLISLHWKIFERFSRDAHEYFVIDNSNRPDASENIRRFCLQNHINYVRLPENPGLDGSLSHGFALNWAYHNLILKYQPKIFGIVDSDLFPTKPFEIVPYLHKSTAWGIITERRPVAELKRRIWYLWAGFAFFRFEKFNNGEPNFLPGWGVDTGGRILVNGAEVKQLPEVYDLHRDRVPIADFKDSTFPIYSYGKFVHLTGASWRIGILDAKQQWIEQFLK